VPAYVSRKSQGFPEEEREIILAPQLFSVICTLFAQAHFLWNFLGGVRINKTEQKPQRKNQQPNKQQGKKKQTYEKNHLFLLNTHTKSISHKREITSNKKDKS